ncbi:8-amino-7-oxononanoate synthase [Candidatus Margulisiibacteriota bacterium]
MFPKDFIQNELNALERDILLRELKTVETPTGRIIKIQGKEYLNFSSNNYLGLANHPEVIKAVQEGAKKWGTGTGSSRLISGNMSVHEELENELARFKGTEACLLFSTGFAANLGAITSLVGKDDAVIIDRLCHASIIDACNLSEAKLLVYPHKDYSQLKEILDTYRNRHKKFLIVTESVFSMDGDLAPLSEIVFLAEEYEAMTMVDEAHATGVFGEKGRGLVSELGLEKKIDVIMGTLSKAFGLQGGFICGSNELIKYLINKARSFVYSTGLTPLIASGALKALDLIINGKDLRKKLWENTDYLKEALKKKELDIGETASPIIPIIIGSTEKALKISRNLMGAGIYVPAIRFPTVAKDQARLRISIMATHTKEDLDKLVNNI